MCQPLIDAEGYDPYNDVTDDGDTGQLDGFNPIPEPHMVFAGELRPGAGVPLGSESNIAAGPPSSSAGPNIVDPLLSMAGPEPEIVEMEPEHVEGEENRPTTPPVSPVFGPHRPNSPVDSEATILAGERSPVHSRSSSPEPQEVFQELHDRAKEVFAKEVFAGQKDSIFLLDSVAGIESSEHIAPNNPNTPSSSFLPTPTEGEVLCKMCGRTFANTISLQRHFSESHEKQGRKCNECGHSFVSLAGLRSHMNAEHPKEGEISSRMECEECGKSCKDRYSLKAHTKNIHGEPEPEGERTCGFCNLVFGRAIQRQNHQRYCADKQQGVSYACFKPGCKREFSMVKLRDHHVRREHY